MSLLQLPPTTRLRLQVKMIKLRHRLWVRSGLAEASRKATTRFSRRGLAGAAVSLVCVFTALAVVLSSPGVANALTLTLDANEMAEGSSEFAGIKRTGDRVQLQDGVVGNWSNSTGLPVLPTLTNSTQNLVYGPNDNLYYLSAFASNCLFQRYDIEQKAWNVLRTPPVGCGAGNLLVWDGGTSMYYAPGSSTGRMFRYDIEADEFAELAGMPTVVGDISAATYVTSGANSYLYVSRGLASANFWRYNIRTNVWESLAPFPTTSNVSNGMSIAWDRGDTLYAYSNDVGELRRYQISTDTWTILPSRANSCIRTGVEMINGKMYVLGLQWCANRYSMRVYDPVSNTWTDATPPPALQNWRDDRPPVTSDGSRYLYAVAGTEIRNELYRFDTVTQSWDQSSIVANNADDTGWHWDAIHDGGQAVFTFGGTNSGSYDRVYRYNMNTKTSVQVGSQIGTQNGYTGTHSGGSLYLMPRPGQNLTTFQRYDVNTNVSTPLAALPFASNTGADIVDGGDGYLYATFGARNSFQRYNIASNTWSALANMPLNTNAGAAIERMGSDIYVLAGGHSGYLMKYNVSANSWSFVPNFPVGSVDWGAFLASDNVRYMYVGVSGRIDATARMVYRFDTVASQWQRIADLPSATKPFASAFWDTNTGKLHVSQGGSTAALFEWTPGSTTYARSGTWFSKVYDFKQVEAWQSLTASVTGSGTTTISTRTSKNGRVWSAWQPVSGTTINSPSNRYFQMKVSLASDGTVTPVVGDIKINHSQETSPPSLPSQFNAYSAKGGAPLTSGESYEWRHPYFSWTPSGDGANGSGVDGYYVYFGTDSSADPQLVGNYQKNPDYTVTDPMTAGDINYLRIKVKDKLGNVSPAATFFSYRYYYVSPPGSIERTSSDDFSAGTNTNLTISNGSMTLETEPNGVWSTGPGQMTPENVRGAAPVVVDDWMYVARGANTTTFWRYNVVSQIWETLAPTPDTTNVGSSITHDGGRYLYLMRGNNTSGFYRYDIQDNVWMTMVNLPTNAQAGSDIEHLGGDRFSILFTGVREFYVYDRATNVFTPKASYPVTINAGGSGTWYDGADTIYAYLGAANWWEDRSRTGMAKYSIANDTWRVLANPPVIGTYSQNNLVSDGRGGLYIFTNSYSDNLSKNQRAMRYDIATDTWAEAPGYNSHHTWGSVASDGKRYIYLLPSGDTNVRRLVRYDSVERRYTPVTPGADTMDRIAWDTHINGWEWTGGNSTTMTYDGSRYVYAIGASEGTFSRFLKFDPKTGETKYLPQPTVVGVSGSMSYLNGFIYYQPGRNIREFYRFDEAVGQWTRMADLPAISYRPGSTALVRVGGELLSLRGNSNTFYKYTPDAGLGTWSTMANAPANVQNGATAYDEANGHLYVVAGNNTTNFWRYDIATNSWTTLAGLPGATTYGSTAVFKNGKIYVQRGNYTKTSYIYDVAGNSWANGVDSPETFRWGATVLDMGGHALALPGESTNDFWQFRYPGPGVGFGGLGVHVSPVFPIAGIFDWASISANAVIPAETQVEFYTRTSVDGVAWDDWSIASDVKVYPTRVSGHVTSPVRRFIQMKLVVTSYDNVSSPRIDGYSLNYYFDVTPPSNPTVFAAYSDVTKATPVVSNTWYNHPTPLFDWPDPGQAGGPTDGALGSRIAGYHVYVGTDPNASPRTAGTFVTGSQMTPSLTAPGTYYVRIQTEDLAGNVDGAIFAPFAYKFDNQAPTNPTLIVVNPSGYTAFNKFSFTWPTSYDAHSGVAGYCYKSGATSGPFAVETCQSGTTLTDLPAAYTQGANVFYVRTYDLSGNFSPAYTTVSYYYSTSPPGPVTNLRAIPPSSPENIFAFIWDLPTTFAGDPAQLSYCYSINALPTPLNTTCTNERFIAPFKAATQQGPNVLYMVARDEANNGDWTSFAFTNFIANTVSPGIPLNVVVADTSDRASKRWSLTITWDKPEFEGNGINSYIVERSEDGRVFAEIGATSSKAYVDLGVTPNVDYYYRVRAADGVDNRGGASAMVSRSAKGNYSEPPAYVVAPMVSADATQAIIKWGTNRPATSFVYYGTSPNDLAQSKGSLETVTAHTQVLSGLNPETTYFYRVQSFDNDRAYNLADSYSQIFNFRTTQAGQIFNVDTDDVTMNSASISWGTSVGTKARIQYGDSLQYGLTVDGGENVSQDHSFKLTGLDAGTTYHYRIVATTSFGTVLHSDDYTFTTIARPEVSGVRFQAITDEPEAGVEVVWTTNVPTSSTVKYSTMGTALEITKSDLVTEHSVTLRNLASDADYQIVVEGRDQYGSLAVSSPQSWHSMVDTRAPVVSDVSISVSAIKGSGKSKAQMIVMWTTDEPSTTQVEYGTMAGDKLDKSTPLETEPTTSHIAIVSDLELTEIYQVRFASKDLSGNNVYGSKTLVVTPDKEESLLDSTLNLLLKVFRF